MSGTWIPGDPQLAAIEAAIAALQADVDTLTTSVAALPPGAVKSIQSGYISGTSATGGSGEDKWYVNTTLSAVDTAKTVVFLESKAFVGSTLNSTWFITGRMTSSTNLRIATLETLDGTPVLICRYTVVEYY